MVVAECLHVRSRKGGKSATEQAAFLAGSRNDAPLRGTWQALYSSLGSHKRGKQLRLWDVKGLWTIRDDRTHGSKAASELARRGSCCVIKRFGGPPAPSDRIGPQAANLNRGQSPDTGRTVERGRSPEAGGEGERKAAQS